MLGLLLADGQQSWRCARKAPVTKAATRKVTVPPTADRPQAPRKITPEQALENTRRLLAEKQQHDRETPAWQSIGHEGGHAVTHDGFQSDEARDRAVGRAQEETGSDGIAGSSASVDRHNQGKRDSRE